MISKINFVDNDILKDISDLIDNGKAEVYWAPGGYIGSSIKIDISNDCFWIYVKDSMLGCKYILSNQPALYSRKIGKLSPVSSNAPKSITFDVDPEIVEKLFYKCEKIARDKSKNNIENELDLIRKNLKLHLERGKI